MAAIGMIRTKKSKHQQTLQPLIEYLIRGAGRELTKTEINMLDTLYEENRMLQAFGHFLKPITRC